MGIADWETTQVMSDQPCVVVLYISRNKDNKDLPGFRERKASYFWHRDIDKIQKEFEKFVKDGIPGEFCRCYVSLNARDANKVRKALLHELIDRDEICFDTIDGFIAGIAARHENAIGQQWFFDFDNQSPDLLRDFIKDIDDLDSTARPVAEFTPHGYAVILEHGIDTRTLIRKWGGLATAKRDDLICVNWKTTPM